MCLVFFVGFVMLFVPSETVSPIGEPTTNATAESTTAALTAPSMATATTPTTTPEPTDDGDNGDNDAAKRRIYGNETVILISIDGYAAKYFGRSNSSTGVGLLAATGVRARVMRSSFPSKTFPNHWSIVTGLYPESHGCA